MNLQDMDTDQLIDRVVQLNIWLSEMPFDEPQDPILLPVGDIQVIPKMTDGILAYRRDVLINQIIDTRIELRNRFISSLGS